MARSLALRVGRVGARSRLNAAAVGFAPEELMQVQPESVLKDEHTPAGLRMNAGTAGESEGNQHALHVRYSKLDYKYSVVLGCKLREPLLVG